MIKRLIIFVFCLVALSVAIVGVAVLLDGRGSPHFSSPDEVRANAVSRFDELFVHAPGVIPDLSKVPVIPGFSTDDSKPGEVKVTWKQEESQNDIDMFGDRIEADPALQSFALPNGQVVRLIAVAHSPGLKKLYENDDPERWGQHGKITWCDPVSLQPIADPESLGLEQEVDIDEHQALFLALRCSDLENRPVRWHWIRMFDERTQASVANSSSRHGNKQGVVIYRHRLKIFHTTPLRLLLPISYGKAEVKEIDLTQADSVARFGGDAVEISIVASYAGEKYSSSQSYAGSSGESVSTYRYREAKPDRDWSQSFSLVSVWPQVQGKRLQFLGEDGKNWRDFHPNNIINAVSHDQKMNQLGTQKWRRLPQQVRGVFYLEGIPGLPELDNLFEAEIGPIRFAYENQFREAITGPTLLDWGYHEKSIPSSEFPITFDDPAITPAQLLAQYENRIGEKLEVDQGDHRITGESDSWLVRLDKWWQKARSRFFP